MKCQHLLSCNIESVERRKAKKPERIRLMPLIFFNSIINSSNKLGLEERVLAKPRSFRHKLVVNPWENFLLHLIKDPSGSRLATVEAFCWNSSISELNEH